MSRIRSNKYITKIYNSSYSTNYTSIQSKDLCNITKHKFYPMLFQLHFKVQNLHQSHILSHQKENISLSASIK